MKDRINKYGKRRTNGVLMKVLGAAFFILHSSFFISCDDPNEGGMFVTPTNLESEMSVTDVLEREPEVYSQWIALLKHANYYNALKDASSKATAFCPTNEAVRRFLADRGVSSVEELPVDYAKAVAQVHIIGGTPLTETQVDNYAKDSTYIPTQTLFGSYLSLSYGYTLTDVDDAQRTEVVYTPDSIFINNQARLEKFTAVVSANGNIFTMGDVIKPLAETIMGRLDIEPEYSIFAQAVHECGFDAIANLVTDTTYAVGGAMVVTTHNYTCFAVPNNVYQAAGITDVATLKSYLSAHSQGEDADLLNYVKYHFMLREYSTSDLFNFQGEGETLIFDTQMEGQAITTTLIDGKRTLNGTIGIVRSDIETKNGYINKVDDVMPVYHPTPVTVKWDFLNTADIIAFVNQWGATKGKGNLFSSPMTTTEEKIDLSEDQRDGNHGVISAFTYKANETKASKSNFRTVGFYKERYMGNPSTSKFGTYMNNYLMLNLGYAGWIELTSPSIIAGTYKVVLHYCSDNTLKSFYTSGSMTRFKLDDKESIVYLYKGLTSELGNNAGTVSITLFPSVTFDGSHSHTFRATMMDINAKTSALFHHMYDYLEFVPID